MNATDGINARSSVPRADLLLVAGMVLALTPGIYLDAKTGEGSVLASASGVRDK